MAHRYLFIIFIKITTVGFVIAITQVTETSALVPIGCIQNKTEERFIDCSNGDIEEVPQQLDTVLEHLDISYNKPLNSFRETDFKKYPKLKILEMKGLNIAKNGIPTELFTPLTSLERLDLSGTNGNYKMPKFPASIKILFVNELSRDEQLDLTALANLKELSMAQTQSKNVPKLNKLAPLTKINFLYSDALDNFHHNDIAPFCLLKELKLDHHVQLTQPDHQVQCCGIVAWAEKHKIQGIDREFRCYSACKEEEKEITSEALDERHDCLVRNGLAMRKLWRNLIIGVIALIALSFLAYLAYRFYDRYYSSNLALDKFVEKEKVEEEAEEELAIDEVQDFN